MNAFLWLYLPLCRWPSHLWLLAFIQLCFGETLPARNRAFPWFAHLSSLIHLVTNCLRLTLTLSSALLFLSADLKFFWYGRWDINFPFLYPQYLRLTSRCFSTQFPPTVTDTIFLQRHHSVPAALANLQTDLLSSSLPLPSTSCLHCRTNFPIALLSSLHKNPQLFLLIVSSYDVPAWFPEAGRTHASYSGVRPLLSDHTPYTPPKIFTEQILALEAVLPGVNTLTFWPIVNFLLNQSLLLSKVHCFC